MVLYEAMAYVPIKNTTDNLDGTISGGRFTVIFSSTSVPKITELSGTVFGADITPLITLVSTPASPVQIQSSVPVSITYSAAGNPSTHRVTLNWADGTRGDYADNSGIVNATHVYTLPEFTASS
jgi:hypothetical protein